MSRMTVEYFNRSGHIPVAQLIKDHEDGQKDMEKSQKSLEPFCLKWQTKAKLKQNKTEDQIKKDCYMIVKAFINADLDFDYLSKLYIKSRELPKESRNFVFENDVLAKLKPIWPLYAPPGLGLTSVIEVLVTMGDWLFPEPGLTSPGSLEVMPLIIQKAPKVQLMSQKSRNENSKFSQSNLVGVNIIEEPPTPVPAPAPIEDQDRYSSDFLLKLMEETGTETGNRVDDVIILDQEERKLVKPKQVNLMQKILNQEFTEETKLYPQILREKLSTLKTAVQSSCSLIPDKTLYNSKLRTLSVGFEQKAYAFSMLAKYAGENIAGEIRNGSKWSPAESAEFGEYIVSVLIFSGKTHYSLDMLYNTGRPGAMKIHLNEEIKKGPASPFLCTFYDEFKITDLVWSYFESGYCKRRINHGRPKNFIPPAER